MQIIERNPNDKSIKPPFGVLILALGDSLYGEYAVNLAASIRFVEPTTPIALVYTNSALTEVSDIQKSLFNYRINCPLEYYAFKEGTCYVKAKLFLNDLTPFKRTLYLDADIIFSPYHKPSEAVAAYRERSFTIANRGLNGDSSGWVDIDYIKKVFSLDKWYDLSSEWMYFDDPEKTNELFQSAREFYEDDKLLCKSFAGGKPDEPALCLAMLKHNVIPHTVPYYPNYWEPVHKRMPELTIFNNYNGISMGGKFASKKMWDTYYNLVKVIQYHIKIPLFFNITQKGKRLTERELI